MSIKRRAVKYIAKKVAKKIMSGKKKKGGRRKGK